LVGNVGDNLLDGGAGVDTLTGGDGADQFVVAYNGTGSTPDQITDFTPGVDLLVIDLASFGIKAGALPLLDAGTVPASSFVKGSGNSAKSTDADDYFVFNISTNTLSFDPDGTGPLAAMGVVKLIGSQPQSMTASDLFVAI
jgi:Ca2+-binding RTX toxin-like protein